jgi:hypothetical protein
VNDRNKADYYRYGHPIQVVDAQKPKVTDEPVAN